MEYCILNGIETYYENPQILKIFARNQKEIFVFEKINVGLGLIDCQPGH